MDYTLLVSFLFLILGLIYVLRRPIATGQLPPMPSGALPVVGHLLQMPQKDAWLKYLQWSKSLDSDIICYKILGTHVIVLNSMQAVNALLEGRASIYSDRPRLLALRHIIGFDWVHGVMPYGKQFIEVRKAANHYLHSGAVKEYQPVQTAAVRKLLKDILNQPKDYVQKIREMAGYIILNATYGVPASKIYIHTVYNATVGLSLGLSPRGLLHDMFPILMKLPEWFPLFRFKKEAKKFAPYAKCLPDLPLVETRRAMARGNHPPSIASSMLSSEGALPDDVIRSVTGSLYVAGLEPTTGIITNFFLAMVKYPEVLKKAQQEIDTVIGTDRLPQFGDEAKLPYVGALVKEVYRWRNITPQAMPHRLNVDDSYKGYRLPKDSIVLANTYAILHDQATFSNPCSFQPERYLDPTTRSPDPAFGYGGRLCPGRFLAKATTWLTIANLLAAFHIERATNERGDPIEPDAVSNANGVVSFPLPFECKIVPRSDDIRAMINSAADVRE